MKLKDGIKQLRKNRNLTQQEFADRIKCSKSAVTSWETGARTPNPSQLEKICKTFTTTEAELYGAVPTQPNIPTQKIPIISWTQAGKFSSIEDWQPAGISDEYLYTEVKGKGIFALRVEGSSMIPEFEEGEVVIVNPNLEVMQNDYVIVADRQENKATFKQYKKYGTVIVLHPLNPRFKDIELDHDPRYVIVGIVVAKEKKYRR